MPGVVDRAYERVALFGGVYSNHIALREVLRVAHERGVERVFFLGDAGGFGPHPDRSIELLADHGVAGVAGNYDLAVVRGDPDCGCGYTDPRDNRYAQLSYDYTLARTSAAAREYLAGLAPLMRIRVGEHRVLLCHGSPRRVNEFLWESATPAAFIAMLLRGAGADAIACTHTGLHWHRALDGIGHLVNVGAIGRPANDGRTEVWFTILNGAARRALDVEFVPVAYDYKALAREMAEESLPPEFIETILSGWWTSCLEVLPPKERARGRY
jgi:predicted phosphodiesterase